MSREGDRSRAGTRLRPECSPLHQLQSLGQDGWLATGDDPHFLVHLATTPAIAGGIWRIGVGLEGEHLERPCIYVDTGSGWTESDRVELRQDGPGHWTGYALVDALHGPARFDPSERSGAFRLGVLELESVEPGLLLLEQLARDAEAFPASAAQVLARGLELAQSHGLREACAWILAGGADDLRAPAGSYAAWIAEHDALDGAALESLRAGVWSRQARPLLSLLLPVAGDGHDQLDACVASLLGQCYPDWELLLVCERSGLSPPMRESVRAAVAASSRIRLVEGDAVDAGAWNAALGVAAGAYLAVIEGSPVFAPHALLAFGDAVASNPGAPMVYPDSDRIDGLGLRHSPSFRPDWNPDLFLARDFVGNGALFDIGRMRAAGGFRDRHAPALAADLALRCLDGFDDPGAMPVHIPMVLLHWPEVGVQDAAACADARRHALRERLGGRVKDVEPVGDGACLRWPLPAPTPRVSIVVPTRDRAGLLRLCVEGILSLTTYPDYEVLVVDNGSTEPAALQYLAALQDRPRVRVLRYTEPFNYAAINNFAVAQAGGDVIALVNNDVEVISPAWLEEMVSQALRPGVGAVGAMLYYPDDTIQHAGVVVGLGGVAGHVYSRQPRGSAGEEGRARLAQSMSAVTAACLVVARAAWDEVGGLDEGLAVAFNDIDFCLRLRQAGYRNLWTPHAELYHHESASRGSEDTEEKLRRFHSEVAFMVSRWGRVLDDDPAYNPNLSLAHGAANALAWPPRRGLRQWLSLRGIGDALPPDADRSWTPR